MHPPLLSGGISSFLSEVKTPRTYNLLWKVGPQLELVLPFTGQLLVAFMQRHTTDICCCCVVVLVRVSPTPSGRTGSYIAKYLLLCLSCVCDRDYVVHINM